MAFLSMTRIPTPNNTMAAIESGLGPVYGEMLSMQRQVLQDRTIVTPSVVLAFHTAQV